MTRDAVYLRQILDFCAEIRELAGQDGERIAERATYLACLHLIQRIGQAAIRMSERTRDATPEVPWSSIRAMRNVIVPEYEHVEPALVRSVVVKDLPNLEAAVRRLLDRL